NSVETSGTHDTEALRVWWNGLPTEEIAAIVRVFPSLQKLGDRPLQPMTPPVHQALLADAFQGRSHTMFVTKLDAEMSVVQFNTPGETTNVWVARDNETPNKRAWVAARLKEWVTDSHRDPDQPAVAQAVEG